MQKSFQIIFAKNQRTIIFRFEFRFLAHAADLIVKENLFSLSFKRKDFY